MVRRPRAAQCFAEEDGGWFAAAAGGVALFAAVDEAVEEGAGGDDGGAGEELAAVAEFETEDAATLERFAGLSLPDQRRPVAMGHASSSRTRSTASAWRMCRLGWVSRTSRILTR